MSGRLLKKILKEQEAQQLHLPLPSSEDEDCDSQSPDSKKNPFDLLGDEGDDESDDQDVPEAVRPRIPCSLFFSFFVPYDGNSLFLLHIASKPPGKSNWTHPARNFSCSRRNRGMKSIHFGTKKMN